MIFIILFFIFGLLIGSFLNVVILRLPEEQSLDGRSKCMSCGHVLSAKDLVPIFSFIFLKGKCAYCGKGLSFRYPLIELITGLLFAAAAWKFFALNPEAVILAVKACTFIAILIAVFVIDFEYYLILDSVLIVGGALILSLDIFSEIFLHHQILVWHGELASSLLAALILVLPFFLIWKFSQGRAMGFGDVKFAIFLGLALGWPLAGVGVFVAFLIGGLTGFYLLASGKKQLKSQVPFGTFLSIGCLIALFFGHSLLTWYLAIIGV